jgi:iron complex outermembrane recepter protein
VSQKTQRNASENTANGRIRESLERPALRIRIPGLALGAFALNAPVLAQQAGPTPTTNTDDANQLQEVVVTGIRASLRRALEIKQQAIGVEDAISAEDIGQFPDASIGEAIARIPGVTVNRGAVGGNTSTGQVTGVTVRGFGNQFNEVLWGGRPVASGNGQSFDFSALGAEYIGELDVHKTPDFALSGGAIGATINIKSPNPFDKPGPQARAFVSGTDYQRDGSVQPAFGVLFSDTFADDTLGILIAGDYTSKRTTGDHFDLVGWKGVPTQSGAPAGSGLPCADFAVAPNGSGCGAVGAGAPGYSAKPSWYPQDTALYLERTDSRRKDGRLSLQWRPSDTVLVTLDDNYSSDDELTYRYQYSTWFGCFPAGCTNVTQDANGTITNFQYPGLNGVNFGGPTDLNANANDTYIVTNTPGINVRWDINDQWSAVLDGSASESKLNPNGTWNAVDADVGYGPNTNLGTNGYFGGLSVSPNANNIPYWTAAGPNSHGGVAANVLGLDPYIIGSHVFPLTDAQNTDRINQVKLDATWHKGDTTVHFGAQFVDDTFDTKTYNTFTNNEWQLWSGYGPASNNVVYYCGGGLTKQCANQNNPGPGAVAVTHGVALPPSLFTPVSIPNFIPGFNGNGNLPQSLLLFNPYSVLNYLSTQPKNPDTNVTAGYPDYTGGLPMLVLSPGSVQHVERKNYSPFATAQQMFPIGDMKLNVNVALRWQRTDSTIAGLAAPLVRLDPNAGDRTAYNLVLVNPAVYTVAHHSYSYALPSLDLNLLIRPELKVRVDASRTETAPNNFQLIPNTTYGGRVDALTATGNNPGLLPYLSDNFDLGAEWYYGDNEYVSVDGFYKHVTQFPVSSIQTIQVQDPNGNVINNTAGANVGQPAQFSLGTTVNGLAANVTGVEIAWQKMLWGGFGYLINGTYVHSNANFNNYSTVSNQFALPGIGNSANLVAFYQANGFQARVAVNWQAKQLANLGQEQGGGAFGAEPVYLQPFTEVDFSTSYEVDRHLSLFFEALNLTDSVYHTSGRFDNQTLNLTDYGRSFTFGVRAKL